MSQRLVLQPIGLEILKVSLQDPQTANSLSHEAAMELDALIQRLSLPNSKIRVLIFTGHQRFFCSGGNLKFYKSLKTKAQGLKINSDIARILKKLDRLQIYKIALVNGDSLGGGLELLSCFQHVVCAPHCLFGFWQSRQGLSFGWGGAARLARRSSMAEVQKALLAGRLLSSFEAQKLGWVDEIVSRHEMNGYVLRLAHKILKTSTEATKEIVKLDLKNESKIFARLWWSKEHRQKLFRKY